MFDRFDDRSIKVILLAQDECRRLGHQKVGSGHLLLGLIGEGVGAAAKLLKGKGVTLKTARTNVEEIMGRGAGASPTSELEYTNRLTVALEMASKASKQLSQQNVRTDHLLIGLIDAGDGTALQVLSRIGVDVMGLRQEIIEGNKVEPRNAYPSSGPVSAPIVEFRESFLTEFINILKFSSSIDDALVMCVNILGKVLRANRCVLTLSESTKGSKQHFEFWESDRVRSCESLGWSALNSILIKQTLRSVTPVKLFDTMQAGFDAADPQSELQLLEIKSFLGVPVRQDGTTQGCLMLHHCIEWTEWTDYDVDYSRRVAEIIASGLAHWPNPEL